jgi:hypothetical protein
VKLRDHAKSRGLDVGCSDSGCIWGAPGGMATNGGCWCGLDAPRTATMQFYRVAQHLAAEVERRAECTCGSGAHPRRCERHPNRYEAHCEEINLAGAQETIADLEAEVELLRPVADTALARRHAFHARHAGDIDEEAYGAAREAFQAALDAYEKAVKHD